MHVTAIGLCLALAPALVHSERERASRLGLQEAVHLADLVVSVQVIQVRTLDAAGNAHSKTMAKVFLVLKGDLEAKEIPVDYTDERIREIRGLQRIEVNRYYILLLFDRFPGETSYRLINGYDGAIDLAHNHLLQAAVFRLCKLPQPQWKDHDRGVRVKLLTSDCCVEAGENVELKMVILNTGPRPLAFTQRFWPFEEQTKALLHIEKDGHTVKPTPVDWLDPEETREHFRKHRSNPYAGKLATGDCWYIYLKRINTAKMGWGYKEWLGFQYYPMREDGRYFISARLERFVPGVTLSTNAVEVYVKKK